MQSFAQALLVYELSHQRAYWLGIIMFAGQLPAFLIAPFSGFVADRYDRRKILIIVQVVEMVQALGLAALCFLGIVQLWHVVILAIILGMVNSFDMTTRHAFAVDMVGKGDLASAIALNSMLINITRMFGPLLAGVLVAAVGERWCFTINGLSYIPVIYGLASMKILVPRRNHETKSVLRHIADGVGYTRKHLVIFRILVLSTFVCLIACPYIVLLPVFGLKVLGGNAYTLSWLNGMLGAGAILATLLFNGVHDAQLIKRRLMRDVLFWGLGLIMLGLSRNFWLSLSAMFTIGYYMMSVFPTMNNAIQQLVDDSMRGRVMSLYTMTFLGTMPFGSLAMGWLADRFTAPVVVTGAGIVTMSMGLGLVFRNTIRHQLRGVATGINVRSKS